MLCITNVIRNQHFLKMQHGGIRSSLWLVKHREANTCQPIGQGPSNPSKITIRYKPYVMPCYSDHDHKNMCLKRPMSPHMEIYAPTLPAMTSIVQRATGLIITAYAVTLAFGALFLTNGIETYVSIIQSLDLSRPTILLIKILTGVPFVFHYFNGIRFCVWNTGRMLAMKDVYGSAHKSWIATAVMTLLFAIL